MKKTIILIFVFLVFIFILYFSFFHYSNLNCINNIKEDNYSVKTKYTIIYKNSYVNKVKIKKIISSKNNTILNFYKKNYIDEFNNYNKEYGGYTITSKKKNNSVDIDILLDVNKVNFNKLEDEYPFMKNNIENNKINLDGIYKLFNIDKNQCK